MNRNMFFKFFLVILLYPLLLLSATWTHTDAATAPISTRPVIASDPLGHLHVAWTADDPYGETLQYATDQSGEWAYQKQIAGSSSNSAYNPTLTTDSYGFAYIAARFYSYNFNIRYFTNAFSTSTYWSSATPLGNAHYHECSIEVDSEGNTHVFAQEDTWGSNVFYQNHDLADVVIDGGTSQFFATAIDPDDVLHFVGSHSSDIWYTSHDGSDWSAPDSINQMEISTYHPSIACDADGNLHVVFASSNGIYYINNTSGTWSAPEQATSGGIFPNVAVDENGKAHIAYYTQVENGGLFYVNNISGAWSAGELITIINTDGSSATEDAAHVESKIALDLKNSTVNIVYIGDGNTVKVACTNDYDLRAIPQHDTTSTCVSLGAMPKLDTLSTSVSGSIELMNFRISDAIGDGLPTSIEEMVFQAGPGMSDDLVFNDVFQSVSLSCSDGSSSSCSVYGNKILAGTQDNIWKNVPDGGSLDFTLNGVFKDHLTDMDGKRLQVKINGLNEIIADTAGSSFSNTCVDICSDTLLFRVVPDHFVFLNLGDDFYNENLIVGWWMQVKLVDANGNIATGVSGVDITLSAVELDGVTPVSPTLQSTDALTKTLTNGVATLNNLTYPEGGQIRVLASCSLLSAASDTITIMPFSPTLLITADDSIAMTLDELGIEYDYYHEGNYQFPTIEKIVDYDQIFLFPSSSYGWYIDSTKVKYFLDSGSDTSRKNLLTFGESGLGSNGATPFTAQYFGAQIGQYFHHTGNGVSGIEGDPVSDNVSLSIPHEGYMLEVSSEGAVGILNENSSGRSVGCRWDNDTYRTVMITPEFSSIRKGSDLNMLISGVFDWFNSFTVSNEPPVLSDIPDIDMQEDEITRINLKDWDAYVTDPDTPLDSLHWQVFGNDHVMLEIVNDTLMLIPDTNYFGYDTIIVSVSDDVNSAFDTVMITIAPVNDLPGNFTLLLPADGTDIPDTSGLMLSWEPSEDIDNDTLYYQVHLYAAAFDTLIDLINATMLTLDDLSPFPTDTTIFWSLSVSDRGDSSVTASNAPLSFTLTHTEVSTQKIVPVDYVLLPNYPNPFNPVTHIEFGLPEAAHIRITVFNTQGRVVAQLVNETLDAGYYNMVWNAEHLPSGIYIFSMQAGKFIRTQKAVLLK